MDQKFSLFAPIKKSSQKADGQGAGGGFNPYNQTERETSAFYDSPKNVLNLRNCNTKLELNRLIFFSDLTFSTICEEMQQNI